MGCDVLYVSENQDVGLEDPELLGLSVVVEGPDRPPRPVVVSTPVATPAAPPPAAQQPARRPVVTPPPRRQTGSPPARESRQPMPYEELASWPRRCDAAGV